MSLLDQRLLRAAILFSRTLGEAGGASILMGGGASIVLGNEARETRVNRVSLLYILSDMFI